MNYLNIREWDNLLIVFLVKVLGNFFENENASNASEELKLYKHIGKVKKLY